MRKSKWIKITDDLRAILTISVERILTMAHTRPSCCALLVKIRSTLIVRIADNLREH